MFSAPLLSVGNFQIVSKMEGLVAWFNSALTGDGGNWDRLRRADRQANPKGQPVASGQRRIKRGLEGVEFPIVSA